MPTFKPSDPVFRNLIENMNEVFWLMNDQEENVYMNPKYYEITGYKPKDVIGKKWWHFWEGQSIKKIRSIDEIERSKGISSSYEATLITKKGEPIPMWITGVPLPEGGNMGIMTDLRKIKEKESTYQQIIEHMNEIFWMCDEHDKTVFVNQKYTEILGYTPEEVIGRPSYEFFDEESILKIKEANKHRKKGKSSTYEVNVIAKNGEAIPILISGTPLPNGKGTIGMMTDLREIKAKEKAEKILTSAIEYTTDAIIIFDKEGNIKSWNKGAKIIFGYKPEDIIEKNIHEIFPGKEMKHMSGHTKVLYNLELNAQHKNRQLLNISATLTPILDDEGDQISFCLLIARDITHQRKFEEELTLKYEKMKEAYNQFGILRRQNDYLFELLDLAKTSPDLKTLTDFIVNSTTMLTKVDGCSLRIRNREKDSLDILSCFGFLEGWEGVRSIPYGKSLAKEAFEQKSPLKIANIFEKHGYAYTQWAQKNNFCSMLLLPLEYQGEVIGCLNLYTNAQKKLEIFENEFIEQYAKVVELVFGTAITHQEKKTEERNLKRSPAPLKKKSSSPKAKPKSSR